MALATGTKLGPYEIQSPLGAGRMGEVYRARDTRLERTVAIKILPSHLSNNAEAKQRFDREARAISSLSHPNICHLYDLGVQDGDSYLVMEYLEGEALSERLLQGRLELDEALKIGVEISDALEKAHRHGVAHRDLKPANIFLTRDGHTKLLDFGLAKNCGAGEKAADAMTMGSGAQLTSPGAALGTVAYMSPEQARGEAVDERSDLFSLGVVIYEMVTGQRPFAGPTTAVVFDAILNRQPPSALEINPGLPGPFARLIERVMEKVPRNRLQTAHEAGESLREMQRERQTASSGKARAARKIPSIAVLPFVNLSSEAGNQYFSDGLSEDLISALTRLQGLQVASRTSAFRFRDGNVDIREIGRQLNVEAVLEGSVRRSDKRLRVTAQLVNVGDGYQLWSERYDREISDIFAIQDEITAAIIKMLEPSLAVQQSALTRRHSDNVQAYELYLKGRQLWDQRTESSLRACLECFRVAIDLDPEYALAHAGLADAFSILAVHGHIPLLEGKPRAEAAVKKAVELDSTLAEAHFSMGLATVIFGDDPGDAEAHLRRALELQPRSAVLQAYMSLYLATRERPQEAIEWARQAVEVDPHSAFVHGQTGLALYRAGAFEEAARNIARALELQPNLVQAMWAQTLTYTGMERWEDAITAGERLVTISRRSGTFLASLGLAYGMSGQREKALALLEELQLRSDAGEYVAPICPLAIHLGFGDREGAHADLLKYIEQGGNGWGIEVIMGRVLERLAGNSPCGELLQKLRAKPLAQPKGRKEATS